MNQLVGYVERFAAVPAASPARSTAVAARPAAAAVTRDHRFSPQAAPNGSWFLAEGVASNVGGGFDTYYLMANPDPTTPVDVHLVFLEG